MYAILDIETTGGAFNEEGITEIAIYRFDGQEITDQFISLVNPEIPIQPFVVKLTGINNAMLQTAPKFFEVAKRILEITADCILVAHNATFDYRVIRNEFSRLGYDFQAPTLDTVGLAQQLIPDMPSYSLGKLSRSLGIPVADRHRASGDALATVKLFKLLLEKDVNKSIISSHVKIEQEKGAMPQHRDIIDRMPSKTGVYYFHKEDGTVLYVGKSRNIKKRVNQHFTGTSPKNKKLQLLATDVSFEETGSELIAQLKETQEILALKPIYNRSYKKSLFSWALYASKDHSKYIQLTIDRRKKNGNEILAFPSPMEGKLALYKLIEKYRLCPKWVGIENTDGACSHHSTGKCYGACTGAESVEDYNARVQEMIDEQTFRNATFLLVDAGRSVSERSAVYLENGVYKGYAYFDLNYQVLKPSILQNILIPMENHPDVLAMIQRYMRQKRNLKIVRF